MSLEKKLKALYLLALLLLHAVLPGNHDLQICRKDKTRLRDSKVVLLRHSPNEVGLIGQDWVIFTSKSFIGLAPGQQRLLTADFIIGPPGMAPLLCYQLTIQ